MNAEEIFLKAIEKRSAGERAAYLDGACGSDTELRAEVEALLDSDDAAGSFLEPPYLEELSRRSACWIYWRRRARHATTLLCCRGPSHLEMERSVRRTYSRPIKTTGL